MCFGKTATPWIGHKDRFDTRLPETNGDLCAWSKTRCQAFVLRPSFDRRCRVLRHLNAADIIKLCCPHSRQYRVQHLWLQSSLAHAVLACNSFFYSDLAVRIGGCDLTVSPTHATRLLVGQFVGLPNTHQIVVPTAKRVFKRTV